METHPRAEPGARGRELVLNAEQLRGGVPFKFAAAGAEGAVDAERRDRAFSEADERVAVADEGCGQQADVGGVADPGDRLDLLLARPFDQLGKVAAGAKGIECGNLR